MLTGSLNQKVVHWVCSGTDGYGKKTYSIAVERKGRWQDVAELFVTLAGKQETSRSILYSDLNVFSFDDYLYLGALADLTTAQKANPALVNTALPVRAVFKSYDLNGTYLVTKVVM